MGQVIQANFYAQPPLLKHLPNRSADGLKAKLQTIRERKESRQKLLATVQEEYEKIDEAVKSVLKEEQIEKSKHSGQAKGSLKEKLETIKTRHQERRKKIEAKERNLETSTFSNEKSQERKIIPLSKKPKDIEEKLNFLKERKSEPLDGKLLDQEHEETLQTADQGVQRIEEELQIVELIECEQEEIEKEINIISQDLTFAGLRLDLIEENQMTLLTKANAIEQSFLTIDSQLIAIENQLEISDDILSNAKEILLSFEEKESLLEEGLENICKEQKIIEELIEDIEDKSDEGLMNFNVIESIENYSSQATALANQMVNQTREEIQAKANVISAYAIDYLKTITTAIEITAHSGRWAIQYCWTYITESISPITWVAMGTFSVFLAKQAINTYPLISICVGGSLFFIFRKYLF